MENDNNYDAGYPSVSSDNFILYRYVLMKKDNIMLLDILSVSSDNIMLYRYVFMEKDNNMMLDVSVFPLTISYCTGIY